MAETIVFLRIRRYAPSPDRGSNAISSASLHAPVVRSMVRSLLRPPLPAGSAQDAGRAGAATISPVMALPALATIAGVSPLNDQIHQGGAAQALGQRPAIRLVAPHQRRFQHEAALHPQVQRQLHRLDRVVATVRVAGII